MYKVRQESQTTFFIANCCKSLMPMIHPAYGNNMTGISIDTAKFYSPNYKLTEEGKICRWHTSDWDRDKDPEAYDLPPFAGVQFRT